MVINNNIQTNPTIFKTSDKIITTPAPGTPH